jgi:hypothetical protein
LVIGDSQFLLNSNLEGLDDWHLGNIMFLRELFERLKSRDGLTLSGQESPDLTSPGLKPGELE